MTNILLYLTALLYLIVIANIFLTLAIMKSKTNRNSFSEPTLQLIKGQQAPAFTATDISGEIVTDDKFRQQTNLFLFVTPDCYSCRQKLPYFQRLLPIALHNNVHPTLIVLGDLEAAQDLLNDSKITIPIIVADESKSSLAREYLLKETPYFIVTNDSFTISAVGPILDHGEFKEMTKQWGQVYSQNRTEDSKIPA